MPIRIMIVDDVRLAREGLRLLLTEEKDMVTVGEAEDGHHAVRMAEHLKPDVILMDVDMPRLDGIEATRQICAKFPQTRIIMLTLHSVASYVQRSVLAGARGYVLKENMFSDVVPAVRQVMKGQLFFDAGIRGCMEREAPDA